MYFSKILLLMTFFYKFLFKDTGDVYGCAESCGYSTYNAGLYDDSMPMRGFNWFSAPETTKCTCLFSGAGEITNLDTSGSPPLNDDSDGDGFSDYAYVYSALFLLGDNERLDIHCSLIDSCVYAKPLSSCFKYVGGDWSITPPVGSISYPPTVPDHTFKGYGHCTATSGTAISDEYWQKQVTTFVDHIPPFGGSTPITSEEDCANYCGQYCHVPTYRGFHFGRALVLEHYCYCNFDGDELYYTTYPNMVSAVVDVENDVYGLTLFTDSTVSYSSGRSGYGEIDNSDGSWWFGCFAYTGSCPAIQPPQTVSY